MSDGCAAHALKREQARPNEKTENARAARSVFHFFFMPPQVFLCIFHTISATLHMSAYQSAKTKPVF
ncbi:MAG: hypothetical protein B6D41_08005 [Chloroflexi bacterium UTCFX4]|jgi:hypothetical protein|nr:MAG: hypothetical protein B6D41_08005 [Chloroflexi bacterium UTCFX4]